MGFRSLFSTFLSPVTFAFGTRSRHIRAIKKSFRTAENELAGLGGRSDRTR
ncbi:MAG TPA: hypothetical protein VJH88_03735 [Candidatus Nanoarchaeia archaeon]|nr:hypothetical protein [Candidatus Nanoarchaeia archaeon]